MKFLILLVALALFTGSPIANADATEVGVRTLSVPSPARGTNLNITIWYPADAGGEHVLVGDSRLFKGTEAWQGAPVVQGRFPLILVSHGSGGRIENLGWLAQHLVAAGFIVAGPNHPGTTSGDSTPADTPKIWQRPADLSAVLTAMTADPFWGERIDHGRIGVLGFSLGGNTAMELAGARANLEAYARYCDAYKTMPDCVWFASDNVDLRQVDRALFEQSNRDPQIKSVVTVDPAIAQAYTGDSLREISIPVAIINLGRADTIPIAVLSDGIAKTIPDATYQTVSDAVHMSFLAECQPDGREFLKSLGDKDPLCDDAGGRSRAEIHAQLADMITAAFKRQLASGI